MTLDERSYSVPRRAGITATGKAALAEGPGLPAQAAALVVLLYLAVADGGFYATDFYPVGLLVLGVLAIWAATIPPARGQPRAAAVAAVLLALFACWALLSIGWADERSAAWDGANRAVLYAAIFALFALWPVAERHARWLVALTGLGIALIGTVELLRFAASEDPSGYLAGGRFFEPLGYQNGNVALWLMGAFCCLSIAVARDSVPVIRGLALGAVPLLASLALMGQSRGSLFALPVALVAFLAISPGRLRLIAALVPVGAAVALAAGPILDVVDASSPTALRTAVDDAARVILLSALVVVAIGAIVSLLALRRPVAPPTARRVSRAAAALVTAAVAVAVAVAFTQAGEIRSEVSDRWDQFKSNEAAGSGTGRLGSAGTNRYDFWTVAWETFEREPLRGVGMDNFQQDYLVRGESREKPRFTHSLQLAVLSETGLVGGALLAGALAAALVAALMLLRRLSEAGAAVAAGALGLFIYWLIHTSVDWLYELPALGGLAFAMLGLAASIGAEARPFRRAPQRILRLALPAMAVAAGASFTLPWLAEREIAKATEGWRASPSAAYERLGRATDLNPASVRAYLFEGTIAIHLDNPRRAERAFLSAVEREPRNQYAWLHLAALAHARQDRAEARRRIRHTMALGPRDEAARQLRDAIAAGTRILPLEVNRSVLKYARGGSE